MPTFGGSVQLNQSVIFFLVPNRGSRAKPPIIAQFLDSGRTPPVITAFTIFFRLWVVRTREHLPLTAALSRGTVGRLDFPGIELPEQFLEDETIVAPGSRSNTLAGQRIFWEYSGG